MPKLYEYFGIIVYFYTNEHEPIHVHGRHAGRESKAEIIRENGRIVDILFRDIPGKRPLEGVKLDTETLELDFLNACDWDTTTTKPSKAKLESLGLKEVAMALHG